VSAHQTFGQKMKAASTIFALGMILVIGCERTTTSGPATLEAKTLEPTPKQVIDDLIKKNLLRVDINFIQVRSSPEFKSDKYEHWSDSEIACTLNLHNFSTQDLVLDREEFTHYDKIEIRRVSDEEQVAKLSPNPPFGVRPPEYFTLKVGETQNFNVQYEAFDCFGGVKVEDDSVRYEFPGDFVIFHRNFTRDRLEFSVDAHGIVRPRFDLKIQDGVEPKTKPEQAVTPNGP